MIFYFLYFLITPLFYIVIHIGKFFSKKIYFHIVNEKQLLLNVKNAIKTKNNNKKILLFHAASTGEFEQLKPILKNIDRKKYFIIQSFTSPTIYNVEFSSSLFDICCYHPYDIWWESYKFFKLINPYAYIVTRHDIWPMHLRIAKSFNIQIIYINANIHKKSIWIKSTMKYFSKRIFNNIDLCLVPSIDIKNQLSVIYPKNKIMIAPDSRFSQVVDRYMINQNKHFFDDNIHDTNNILFGSYDLSDLDLICDAITTKYCNGDHSLIESNHRIILVPHEIDTKEIYQLKIKLNHSNFTTQLYSELKKDKLKSNIIIVDYVGILADIYKYAYLAYVGGGFTKGVHSILEPGIYGCAICFGPNIELLDELKNINDRELGTMIYNVDDLLNILKKSKRELNQQGKKLQKFILNQKQNAKEICAILDKKINE